MTTIYGVAVDNVGMDVRVKLGDSRRNGFREIRGADFVSNERTCLDFLPREILHSRSR